MFLIFPCSVATCEARVMTLFLTAPNQTNEVVIQSYEVVNLLSAWQLSQWSIPRLMACAAWCLPVECQFRGHELPVCKRAAVHDCWNAGGTEPLGRSSNPCLLNLNRACEHIVWQSCPEEPNADEIHPFRSSRQEPCEAARIWHPDMGSESWSAWGTCWL